MAAADQLIDCVNGLGPNFDVSLLHEASAGRLMVGYLPAKVPEDGG